MSKGAQICNCIQVAMWRWTNMYKQNTYRGIYHHYECRFLKSDSYTYLKSYFHTHFWVNTLTWLCLSFMYIVVHAPIASDKTIPIRKGYSAVRLVIKRQRWHQLEQNGRFCLLLRLWGESRSSVKCFYLKKIFYYPFQVRVFIKIANNWLIQ